jgi:hypothetical protein
VRLFYRRGTSGVFLQYNGTFTASPITFLSTLTGGDGLYSFYTIGTDGAMNEETAPATPDAQIEILGNGPAAPRVAEEPAYHRGTGNTIWFAPPGGAEACLLEWGTDPAFAGGTRTSGWLARSQSNYNVRDLADGQTHYYRVRARNEAGIEGPWSVVVSSTPDASPPESQVVALDSVTRTSTFTIQVVETDAVSGVKETQLYYRRGNSGPFTLWPDVFTSGTLLFDVSAADGAGLYQFYSMAEDNVGNLEGLPSTWDAQTLVDLRPPDETRATRWMIYR